MTEGLASATLAFVVSRDEMLDLVRSHEALDDPMGAAIWIRRNDREAWLVEVLPDLGPDEDPGRPVTFNAGRSFRHQLNLIASNEGDLERAIRQNEGLARDIANGEILYENGAGHRLQLIAIAVARDNARAG